MTSCIIVLYTTLLTLSAGAWCPVRASAEDPDRLYANRAVLADAQRAAAIWRAALARNPADVESAWKLARAQYWIGGRVDSREVRRAFEEGIDAAGQAIRYAPARPEGHFWRAANMGGLAETQGLAAGLRYRTSIRRALERVLAIDPAYQQGSADRALGRWYFKVPRLFGGSKARSEEHLRRALTYNADSTVTRFFLAETLLSMDRPDEAIQELQRVIDSPAHPEWAPEDAVYKQKARELLSRLARSK